MPDENRRITRRHFIRLGATGVAAVGLSGLSDEGAEAAARIGRLPYRRYGRTGLNISAIIGASDWPPAIIPTAVEAGVNYWHKAQAWADRGLPEAIKRQPRESYYLECVVDRVGGNHERGRIDEEQHYQFVKSCVQRSGVRYYDVMKFHFGYHSVKEAKEDLGMVRAFQRLKKQGLVRHLAISQHHYKSIGGDMAHEILTYLIERSPYEAAQFFYTYGDSKDVENMIALARKRDFGTIAMKTMAGVQRAARDPKLRGLKPGAAMVKWVLSNPNLTAATVAIRNFAELLEDFSGATRSAMTPQDEETLRLLAAHNKGLTCLLCSECVSHCPEEIAVVDILRYERYARDYGDLRRARAEYAALTKDGASCVACGNCLAACPSEIPIAEKLREVHRLLG